MTLDCVWLYFIRYNILNDYNKCLNAWVKIILIVTTKNVLGQTYYGFNNQHFMYLTNYYYIGVVDE